MTDIYQRYLDYGFEDWGSLEGFRMEFPLPPFAEPGDRPAIVVIKAEGTEAPTQRDEPVDVYWYEDFSEHIGGNENLFEDSRGARYDLTAEEALELHTRNLPAAAYVHSWRGMVYELVDGRVITTDDEITAFRTSMRDFTLSDTPEAERGFRELLELEEITYLPPKEVRALLDRAEEGFIDDVWLPELLSVDDLEVILDQALTDNEYQDEVWGLTVAGDDVYISGYAPFQMWGVIEDRGLNPIRTERAPQDPPAIRRGALIVVEEDLMLDEEGYEDELVLPAGSWRVGRADPEGSLYLTNEDGEEWEMNDMDMYVALRDGRASMGPKRNPRRVSLRAKLMR